MHNDTVSQIAREFDDVTTQAVSDTTALLLPSPTALSSTLTTELIEHDLYVSNIIETANGDYAAFVEPIPHDDDVDVEAQEIADAVKAELPDVVAAFDDMDSWFETRVRWTDEKDVTDVVLEQAELFVDYLRDNGELNRRQNPYSVAAGVTHAAACTVGLFSSQNMAEKATGVTTGTIRKYQHLVTDLLEDEQEEGTVGAFTGNQYCVPEAKPMMLFSARKN